MSDMRRISKGSKDFSFLARADGSHCELDGRPLADHEWYDLGEDLNVHFCNITDVPDTGVAENGF